LIQHLRGKRKRIDERTNEPKRRFGVAKLPVAEEDNSLLLPPSLVTASTENPHLNTRTQNVALPNSQQSLVKSPKIPPLLSPQAGTPHDYNQPKETQPYGYPPQTITSFQPIQYPQYPQLNYLQDGEPPLLPHAQKEAGFPPETLHNNNYNQGEYSGDRPYVSDQICLVDLCNFLKATPESQMQTIRTENSVTIQSKGMVATLKNDIKLLEDINLCVGDTCQIGALCGYFINSLGNECWLTAHWGKEWAPLPSISFLVGSLQVSLVFEFEAFWLLLNSRVVSSAS